MARREQNSRPALAGEGWRNPQDLFRTSGGRAQLHLTALLGLAVLLGGGGVGEGLFNLAIQLFAIAILAINPAAVVEFVTRTPRALVWLALATLALPLIQSIPLPPTLWQTLPGRDLVYQSLALVGRENGWFSWSVNSGRTLLSAISLLPCLAILVLGQRLEKSGIEQTFQFLVVLGLVNLGFGAIQLATGNSNGNFYPDGDPSTLYGTFANRNSAALFLDISLVALLALPVATRDNLARGMRVLLGIVLATGVLLTQSRSGTALLVLVLAAWLVSIGLARARSVSGLPGRRRIFGMLLAGLAVLAGGGILLTSQKLDQTFSRFENLGDVRPEIWEDSLISAGRFWPVGSGISTFDEVFQIDESLEYLDGRRAGRAHNDYLELVIESGAIGVILVAAWFLWLSRTGWRAIWMPERRLQRAAFLVVVLILAQSAIDYPLRNQALLCVAAFMVNVLGSLPKGPMPREASH